MGGDVAILPGWRPGALGRVAELHGEYYHRGWGFGLFFEAKVATELAAFLERLDPERDGFWGAWRDGRLEGAVAIDGADAAAAHLRWFIVADGLRGRGVGGRLVAEAVGFCRAAGHRRVVLWTFAGLDAARRLYGRHGFRLAEERRGARWGTAVTEQRFELELGAPG